jgi:hypothetical protein
MKKMTLKAKADLKNALKPLTMNTKESPEQRESYQWHLGAC